ncbi:MAG: PEP-CTERM sorting domain-containing protein [Bryobacteraceae bacterium]
MTTEVASAGALRLESFVAGGANFLPGDLNNMLDGNTSTSTAMGQTNASDRMRVTVGFAPSSSVPEPSTCVLGGAGLAAIGLLRRRRAS